MAKRRGIRVRISHQRVTALRDICSDMLNTFQPENDHQVLLREYMLELRHKLQNLAAKNQETYTITLSGTEAIAFYQLWQTMDVQEDRYAALVIDGMIKKLSALAA